MTSVPPWSGFVKRHRLQVICVVSGAALADAWLIQVNLSESELKTESFAVMCDPAWQKRTPSGRFVCTDKVRWSMFTLDPPWVKNVFAFPNAFVVSEMIRF